MGLLQPHTQCLLASAESLLLVALWSSVPTYLLCYVGCSCCCMEWSRHAAYLCGCSSCSSGGWMVALLVPLLRSYYCSAVVWSMASGCYYSVSILCSSAIPYVAPLVTCMATCSSMHYSTAALWSSMRSAVLLLVLCCCITPYACWLYEAV